MAVTLPLYVMQSSGKFLKFDLRTQAWQLISDHGSSGHMVAMVPSADARWISYSGVRARTTQYWLYDRQSNTERIVLEHPAWGGGIPEFSPDSKLLAIAASYDSRWKSGAGAGIHLVDTATGAAAPVLLPVSTATAGGHNTVQWSVDGKLLIMVRSGPGEDEYFTFHPATKAVETVSGRYDTSIYEHVFIRRGTEIAAFKQLTPRSNLGLKSESSPGGEWHASLGPEGRSGRYPLTITQRNGGQKTVAYGRYEQCGGKTVLITGWIDEHHLVYRDSMLNYWIVDATTGGTADLFKQNDGPVQFTW